MTHFGEGNYLPGREEIQQVVVDEVGGRLEEGRDFFHPGNGMFLDERGRLKEWRRGKISLVSE